MSLIYKSHAGTGDGVFQQTYKIINVVDRSGEVHEKLMKAFDLWLELTFEQGVADKFKPYPFDIFGNLKRTDAGEVVDFGSAFKLGVLFDACGLELSLDDNNRIPNELTGQLVGKSISVIRYAYKWVDGKMKTKGWDIVGSDAKRHRVYFDTNVSKGKIKDYTPVQPAADPAQGELKY